MEGPSRGAVNWMQAIVLVLSCLALGYNVGRQHQFHVDAGVIQANCQRPI